MSARVARGLGPHQRIAGPPGSGFPETVGVHGRAPQDICAEMMGKSLTSGLTRDTLRLGMIQSFRHRGLKQLYEKDNPKGLHADQVDTIARILARLDEAAEIAGMDLPDFKLHPLKGDLKGFWAVSVSGNWQVIFRFEGGHACDVDLVDYH